MAFTIGKCERWKKAMQLSGVTCSERGLRRRFKRFFKRQDRKNGFASDRGYVVPFPDSLVPYSPSRDSLVPSPPSTGNAQQLADSSMAPRGECGLALDVSTKPTRASARISPKRASAQISKHASTAAAAAVALVGLATAAASVATAAAADPLAALNSFVKKARSYSFQTRPS